MTRDALEYDISYAFRQYLSDLLNFEDSNNICYFAFRILLQSLANP